MKTRIIKRWDKTFITKAFLLEFQLATMETNTITLFFKETIDVEEKMEANVDVDALPMLEVVEKLPSTYTTIYKCGAIKNNT